MSHDSLKNSVIGRRSSDPCLPVIAGTAGHFRIGSPIFIPLSGSSLCLCHLLAEFRQQVQNAGRAGFIWLSMKAKVANWIQLSPRQ